MKFWQSRYSSQDKLSQQEILEISQKISRDFYPNVSSAFPGLVLLPVDPFHLYAYWTLGENTIKSELSDYANFQLTLRIYWQFNENSDFYRTKQWFDVKVNGNQHRQKVRVPNDETFYSAVIGKHYPDDSFAAYAYSNIIHLPRSRMAPIIGTENETTDLVDESNQLEVVEQNQRAEQAGEVNNTVLNNFIMKDNLYVESTKVAMNSKHKPAVTSHPANHNNASGLGIKYQYSTRK